MLAIVAPMKSSTSAFSSVAGRKSCSIGILLAGEFVVDLRFFLFLFMWPFAAAVDSGRYFCTRDHVRNGKPMSWPLSIALHNMSTVGEKGIDVGIGWFQTWCWFGRHCWLHWAVCRCILECIGVVVCRQ